MPDWERIVRERLGSLRFNGPAESDLVTELSQHLEDRYRELCSGGADEEQAYRNAISELNNLYPLREDFKRMERLPRHDPRPIGDTRRGSFLGDIGRDLRYTFRTLRKSPGFVGFVVLTLALGIGANTTVFTVINTLILNPLPVPGASGLAAVGAMETANGANSRALLPVSYADLKDYESQNGVFRSLAGYTSPRLVTFEQGQGPERLFAELVTANYFRTLELRPARGRFFLPKEDGTPGERPVAVLNYGTWQTRFGQDPNILGKVLRLNNIDFTVIGIAPPQFIGLNAIFGPDLWIPSSVAELLLPEEMQNAFTDRGKGIFQAVGRLKPNISRARAQANVAAIASSLAREYPESEEGHTAVVRPMTDILFGSAMGGASPVLFASAVLSIVVGIVLLIACSNVANLLLARVAVRQHEFAVRLSNGASRGRLVRQLLTESCVLGLLSGIAGFVVGYAGLKVLWTSLPAAANFIAPRFDWTVFLFALLISLFTGFAFGAIPALRASRTSLAETLKEESPMASGSRKRITAANVLLAGQVAFSFLLLLTATLFLRSIQRAYDIDPGFQTKHLAVFMTNPGQAGYGNAQTRAFYKDVRERVTRMPDIQSVSWASNLPLWARKVSGVKIEGREQRSKAETITAILDTVDVDYFETAGVPIDQGRAFSEIDQQDSAPVAIVNEKMARSYWQDGNALGRRIQLPGEKKMRRIVAIARTANYSNLGEPPQPCVYVPLEQNFSDAMTLYVRTKDDPQQALLPVERAIRAAAPRIYAKDMRTGREIISSGLFQARVGVMLLTVFGVLALGLASVGLYGILAYSVSLRRREIGMRIALGATQAGVLGLILKQGMSLVAVGIVIGLVVAQVLDRLLSRMLYGVSASDPLSIFGAGIILLAVAMTACYLPARWASRLDPLVALR